MILLYTLLLLVLGGAAFLARRRTSRLERKYYRVATDADRLAHNQTPRPGAAGRNDPYQVARRQYELGLLVQKRDRLEGKYDYWQHLTKRLGSLMDAIRAWQGRKLPYAFGVIDVSLALFLMEQLSAGQYTGVKQLVDAVASLVK